MNKGKWHKILGLLVAFLFCIQLFMVSIHQFHYKKPSYDLGNSPCSLCMIFHAQNHIIPLSSITYPKKAIVKEVHKKMAFLKKETRDLLQKETISLRGP